MKIVALKAENIKRLVAVEIKPDGNLVQITGKNGQGKTSVLDCIWWALAGASHIQSTPIRKGEDKARIRLDLGEIIVTRTFTAKDGGTISAITVENEKGARFPSPQAMLDDLLGQLSFDPLSFARMEPKAQYETLKKFVPGVDFESIESKQRFDYALRTDVSRRAKEARIQADRIEIPADIPDALVDEVNLIGEMEAAGKHNAEIEQRKANRADFQNQIERKKDAYSALTLQIEAANKRLKELLDEEIKAKTEIANMATKLSNAAPLPEPIDTGALRQRIADAKAVNEKVQLKGSKKKLEEMADKLKAEADEISQRMEAREEEKRKSIADAKLPVEGITFGAGEVLMNGVPFEQASDAEQLRISIAIAMALNPKLRVIRVRDGSLLDEESLKLISDMADKEDYQVWCERVDSSGKIGFVLENGHIKGDK